MGSDQVCGAVLHLVQTEQEDAVALEEFATVGTADAADHVRTRGKPVNQDLGGVIGAFRRTRIDDRNDLVDPLRKSIVEHLLLLPPCERAGQELFAVSDDGEMPREIGRRDDCQEQEAQNGRPGVATRQLDEPCDRGHGDIACSSGNCVGGMCCRRHSGGPRTAHTVENALHLRGPPAACLQASTAR